MGTYKKLALWLVFTTAWATLLLSVNGLSPKAEAATCDVAACSQTDITASASSYEFTDQAHIVATFNGKLITFTDGDVSDGNHRYDAPPNTFCGGGNGVGTVKIKDWSQVTSGSVVVDGVVDVDYQNSSILPPNNCIDWGNMNVQITNPSNVAKYLYQWTTGNNSIIEVDGSKNLTLLASKNSDSLYGEISSGCNPSEATEYQVILINNPGDSLGKLFIIKGWNNTLGPSSPNNDVSSDPLIGKYFTKNVCYVVSGPTTVNIASAGLLGSDPGTPTCTVGSCPAPATNTSDCVKNNSTSLEWFLCPITTALSKAVDGINKLIEDQLSFDVKNNLSDTGGTHTAWVLIKNLVTSMIVIVMLVMVISQAIGGALFDAYTIKKMLPKLVIAVIAMQVSWYLCKWAITLANDTGHGVKQLLVAPFGGGGNMDLNSILHELDPAWALGTQGIILALMTGGIVLALVTLPATLVMAFGLFIGVFMALAVLLFRNVLIVALVLFAPLAFLLWVLPGQGSQKMWKFWSDNFTKLLMLFPLIIAIIYTGRIVAWIVATTNHGTVTISGVNTQVPNNGGFIDVLTILVAYFGPYFIIFKAYKWGGSALATAGNAASKGRQSLTKANAPWLQDLGKRAQGSLANRYNLADKVLRDKRAEIGKTQSLIQNAKNRRADLVKAGKSTAGIDAYLANLEGKAPLQESELAKMERQSRRKRGLLRIGAGKPLPTKRQQVETLARAAEHKEDWVKLHTFEMGQDYQEQLDSGKSVKDAKKFMMSKHGRANYENVVDADGNVRPQVKDSFKARAFNSWMLDTKSALELSDEDLRLGAIKDKRGRVVGYESDPNITPEMAARGVKPKLDIGKTSEFISTLNSDGQKFAYIQQSVPELVPFYQALGGGPRAEDYLDGGKRAAANPVINPDQFMPGGTLEHYNPTGDRTMAEHLAVEQREVKADVMADAERWVKIYKNLEHTGDIVNWRPEEFKAQDDLVKKMRDLGVKDPGLETTFKAQFEELRQQSDAGSQEARGTITRLTGGENSARTFINGIMGNPNWVEDALHLPVTVGDVPRATALPKGDVELGNRVLLVSADPKKANLVVAEVARVLAEDDGYAVEAHQTPRAVILSKMDALIDSARTTRNRDVVTQINKTLDIAEKLANERAQRLIKAATAAKRADLPTYEEEVAAELRTRVEEIRSRRLNEPTPGDDPTVLDLHPPPPPPPAGPTSPPPAPPPAPSTGPIPSPPPGSGGSGAAAPEATPTEPASAPTEAPAEPDNPSSEGGIPPEDFEPGGRFPPPNIPPGPGNG